MLDYKEIRRRLNIGLQKMLAVHSQQLMPPSISFPELDLTIRPQDLLACAMKSYRDAQHTENAFVEIADKALPQLIKMGLFAQNEVTEAIKPVLGKLLAENEITYLKILKEKEQGDFSAENELLAKDFGTLPPECTAQPETPAQEQALEYGHTDATQPSMPVPQQVHQQVTPPTTTPKPLYSQVVARYARIKQEDGAWKAHSVADHMQRLNTVVEILGDRPVSDLTRKDMRDYRDTLRQLPPNRSRSSKYSKMTIKEIVASKPPHKLSVKTVNVTVEAVASFLEWCVREEILEKNPGKGLQVRDDRQAIELRDTFTPDDIAKLFSNPVFLENKTKKPAYYWIPLIALYTGMRLEEVAQLHCADLYQVEDSDLWVIDVNDKGIDEEGLGKNLKNKNARRLVPVHPTLLKEGLLAYANSVYTSGAVRLFPSLRKTEKTGKYGKQPGKQFGYLVKKILGEGTGKSFHSLRHFFADYFKQRGLQTDVFRQVYGHELPHLASSQYGAKFPPQKCYEDVIAQFVV